jgi:hypothetical protein
MRRREFIAGLGSATAWPVAVRAQQSKVPMVGYIGFESLPANVAAFFKGLGEAGYVDGRKGMIIAGHRRVLAAQRLGIGVPCKAKGDHHG